MYRITRPFNFLRSTQRPLTDLRASVSGKPAKNPLSSGEQVFVMTTLFATILGPAAWILSHLEEYKSTGH